MTGTNVAQDSNNSGVVVEQVGMFLSTKSYYNYPCAHRQWKHDGNCKLIHGYSRSFHLVFGSITRDKCGFVVDFGNLKWLKNWLDHMFDHTLLLETDDPELDVFRDLEKKGACSIRIMPYGVGMEGTAQLIFEFADQNIRQLSKGRCWVIRVEARENDKNSAIYVSPKATFHNWT